MASTKRIPFIDIAKGIMIILLIFHHLPQVSKILLGLENVTLEALDGLKYIYCTFFMQAFFVITGYCSNFDKNYKKFLTDDVRTILLPAFLFTILISCATTYLLKREVRISLFSYMIWGSSYWFLNSMFIGKQIYYWMNKLLKNQYVIVSCCFGLLIGGVVLASYKSATPWSISNTLTMLIFLWIGRQLREIKINKQLSIFRLCSVAFLFAIIPIMATSYAAPYITMSICVNVVTIPLFLYLAVNGGGMLFYLSILIRNSKPLEYLGRNTIVIYMVHIFFLEAYQKLWIKYLFVPENSLQTMAFVVAIATLTIISSLVCIFVLNSKYLRWMIGKK